MAGRSSNLADEATRRADNNREKQLAAVKHLHRLLALAMSPNFSGTIAVEVSAKDGALGRPKMTLVEYDRESGG